MPRISFLREQLFVKYHLIQHKILIYFHLVIFLDYLALEGIINKDFSSSAETLGRSRKN